ncbi:MULTISPECIES: hypothetical protein [unclassified Streptomyces]|nr:hypothetical protein [Streptomyces sp. DSM 41633]
MNPQEETSIKSMDAILEALNAAHEAPVEIARSMAWSIGWQNCSLFCR